MLELALPVVMWGAASFHRAATEAHHGVAVGLLDEQAFERLVRA